MRPLMVLGCTSDAGKSLIATALCAWFARRGVDVAPFKGQNMSNNARVVAGPSGSGEIGVAQWLQAKAAGVVPDVRMNPVLLKPEADTASQVVVLGHVDHELSRLRWEERHDALWTPMADSVDALRNDHELVIIEGAGSPAEINLRDQVNHRVLTHTDAAGLLVSDIDRGGSFAHLYGTWALIPDEVRQRLAAFVLNRFRGDASLLAPGPERLSELTGMADAGVMPMLQHRLPREEGAAELAPLESVDSSGSVTRVVLPRIPFGSNLDEFHLLATVADVSWATSKSAFEQLRADDGVIVLPGSKHVAADTRWMGERGIDRAIIAAADRGVRVIGVCGGAMMLGTSFADPFGLEGRSTAGGDPVSVLGLVDVATELGAEKLVQDTEVTIEMAAGSVVTGGYEIRLGRVEGEAPVAGRATDGSAVAWTGGAARPHVIATTVHGLFEDPSFVETVIGRRPEPVLEQTFEQLADAVEEHLDTALLLRLVEA